MYHIKITDLDTGKTTVDMDSNCIIGACEIAGAEQVQGFGCVRAPRNTVGNVAATLLQVVEEACTNGEDRSLYDRVMIPVILKAMKLMGGEPADDDAETPRVDDAEPANWAPGGGRDEHAD